MKVKKLNHYGKDKFMYRLICKDGNAKRGEVTTVHGTIQTPVFMNVGTAAAIKGAVSSMDLKAIKIRLDHY